MRPETIWERIAGYFGYLPITIAFRIIWLTARIGGKTANAIYDAMWDANLDLPRLDDRPVHTWVDEWMCRQCGCTDSDACVDEKTGEACSWAEQDLCTACSEKS